MIIQNYNKKEDLYFNNTRLDILPLLPKYSETILEIGCGNGATLKHLKDYGKCKEATGIELTEYAALEAKQVIDKILIGDAEEIIKTIESNTYDLVLCLDILEHLVDPWLMIEQISRVLKKGGVIISSIPNIRTIRVISKLALFGKFEYEEAGIMDKTHLRFFTKTSAIDLLSINRLEVDRWIHSPFADKSKSSIFNTMTFGFFRDLLTEQYIIRAVKK
jgi:SAM-dependent methyltransferase